MKLSPDWWWTFGGSQNKMVPTQQIHSQRCHHQLSLSLAPCNALGGRVTLGTIILGSEVAHEGKTIPLELQWTVSRTHTHGTMWAMSYLAMIAAPRMHCLRCVWKDPQLQKEDAFFRVFQWTHVPIYRLIMANHNHGPMPGVKIKMIYLPTYLSIYLSIYILILWPDLGVCIYINIDLSTYLYLVL